MKWFKFYGQDWLTDLKIINLSIEDRLCYMTLLCLASMAEDYKIKDCDEDTIIRMTHLHDNPYDTDNEYMRAQGFLSRLEACGMIERDNKKRIIIKNFEKRQNEFMTTAERSQKYRDRKKSYLMQAEKTETRDERHLGSRDERHCRKDKNRVEVDNINKLSTIKNSKPEKNIQPDKKQSAPDGAEDDRTELNKQISDVIDKFRTINPTISFGHKTIRNAAEELIKKFGFTKTVELIEYALAIQGRRFAPTITTPYQLKIKIGELQVYAKREAGNRPIIV